jgi:hypothetical protein
MWEQYIHLLIPSTPHEAPSCGRVADFFIGLSKLGSLPQDASLTLTTIVKTKPTVREGPDPFRPGKTVKWVGPSWVADKRHNLGQIADLPQAAAQQTDYRFSVEGTVPPSVPPLTIDFNGAYHLGVSCEVRSKLVSMSDSLDSRASGARFGEEFSLDDRTGYFTHPETEEIIEVPNAGCANYWIAFELGKFLFPKFRQGLAALDPRIVRLATECFGDEFGEGCRLF